MNRAVRSRMSGIAGVLLLTMFLSGCCLGECLIFLLAGGPLFFWLCMGDLCPVPTAQSQACTENSEECAAWLSYYQTEAIQFCEEHPEQCQENFDSWVESLDAEAGE